MNGAMTCECCGRRAGTWHDYEGAEVTLCRACVKELREWGAEVVKLTV